MIELIWLFISQFMMVGALGLQSKLNRDHRLLPLFINSCVIGYIQADVFIEDITVIAKLFFCVGGAIGLVIFTEVYERNERYKSDYKEHR